MTDHSHDSDRAERAILSHAEAYRLVQEARDMRLQRDMAQHAVLLLNSMILSGESHSDASRAAVRRALQDMDAST